MASTLDTTRPPSRTGNASGSLLTLIFTALAWPIWLFLVFYVYWWVPHSLEIFNDFNVQLPGVTLFFLDASNWIPILTRQTFPLLIGGIFSVIFAATLTLTLIHSLRHVLITFSICALLVGLTLALLALYAVNAPLSDIGVL